MACDDVSRRGFRRIGPIREYREGADRHVTGDIDRGDIFRTSRGRCCAVSGVIDGRSGSGRRQFNRLGRGVGVGSDAESRRGDLACDDVSRRGFRRIGPIR